MGLENATYINELNAANPTSADPKSAGDDHLRLLKSTIKATLPGLTGAMTATQAELNILDGATLSTAELNVLDGVTASTAELNILDGATLSTTELNYVDGVTSPIQDQFGAMDTAKGDVAGQVWTGAQDFTGATATVATPTLAAQAATKGYVDATVTAGFLPAQAGNAGKIIETNGATASWQEKTFVDTATVVKGSVDPTKGIRFEVDGLTAGALRVLTPPDKNGTLAMLSDLDAPIDSAIVVRTGNGAGSTNTTVRRFTTTFLSIGASVTYADSATLGATFTINENGIYAIEYEDQIDISARIGMSRNAPFPALGLGDSSNADSRLAMVWNQGTVGSEIHRATATTRLTAGDIIRAHLTGTAVAASAFAKFTIRKVNT